MTQQTLLVVDDNPVNLKLLFDYLSNTGYRVLVSEDAESALEQAVETRPDLILMDVLLPGMNGFDACRALKADDRTNDIPVIFLTALARASDKVEGFRAGGVDYLTKPLQFEEVSARIRTHLKLRELQNKLETQNQALYEANRRKDRVFTIIAHDLRSPVASFVSAMRVLGSVEPGGDDYREVIETLAARANRMEKLVGNLLDWAGLQLESGELKGEKFHLLPVARLMMDLALPEAEPKNLRMTTNVDESVLLYQSREALQAVLTNLVSNAVKFTPAGGTVTLIGSQTDTGVRIEVCDTGVGMSEAELARLFRIDDRLHKPGTSGEKGSGLGLILASELIDRMHGQIKVVSKPDAGTTMAVELPNLDQSTE